MAQDHQDDPRIYMQIAADLRAKIERGQLEGGKVPSITTLTQEWEVSRRTAGHALQVLEDEGLIRRWPGRGYYIS